MTGGPAVEKPGEGEGLVVVDMDQTIVYWNEVMERWWGRRYLDVLTVPCYRVVHGETEDGLPWCFKGCVPIRIALAGGKPPPCTLRTKLNDGAYQVFRARYQVIPARDPKHRCLAMVLSEVPAQMQATARATEDGSGEGVQ